MSKNFFSQISKSNGFSLLEIVVALSIVTVGFLGLLSLSQQGIQIEQANRNSLSASLLAQECLEMARNIRDQNWLDEYVSDFDNGLIGSFDYDYLGNLSSSKIKLTINNYGFYAHVGSEESIFSREITANLAGDYNEYLLLTCVVTWDERGREREYKAVTKLYDWK